MSWRLVAVVVLLLGSTLPVWAQSEWQTEAQRIFLAGKFKEMGALVEPHAKGGHTIEQGLAAAYLAGAYTMQGDFDHANEWHARAETIFKSEKSDALVGQLLVARAVAAFLNSRKYSAGAPEDALAFLDQAKPLLGADHVMLQMVMAEMMGRSSKAMHVQNSYLTYMKLIAQFESAGDSLNMAHCAVRLAGIDGATGGHQSALAAYVRGARIFEDAGKMSLAALNLRNAGHASRKVRDYVGAERFLKRSLEIAKSLNHFALEARILNDLSRCYTEMERHEDAATFDRLATVALNSLGKMIGRGELEDSVATDFYQLYKGRYASLLLYETDLWYGFYDQLIVGAEN